MNLQQVKETINKAGFSEESLRLINEILDGAIASGTLTLEAKEKLLGIVDLEIDTANLEADTMEEVAMALESFANEVDSAVDKTESDIEAVDKNLLNDVNEATAPDTAPTQ